VHNIRIERLWVDVTVGIGNKWYEFFSGLERHAELDINNDVHIWLLHLLFLEPINWELTKWAETWNSHTMSLRGMKNQSPSELFFFGMVEQGVRGGRLEEAAVATPTLEEYGVDWANVHNASVTRHHRERNPGADSEDADVPANATRPRRFSRVDVPSAGSPLTTAQTQRLLTEVLQQHGDLRLASMAVRRMAWSSALQHCRALAVSYGND
jgi:hypothetical protein